MEDKISQKHCPKCGKENPDNAQTCSTCDYSLAQVPSKAEKIHVRVSGLAISAFILGLLCILIIPLQLLMLALNILYVVMPIAAILLGITSLIQIGMSAGRVTGKGFAVIGIVIPIVIHLAIMVAVSFKPHRHLDLMVCGTNLAGLGKAMLIYAGDYDERLPLSGGSDCAWAPRIPDWKADNLFEAFNMQVDGSGGQTSISSSLYLLVKYCDVTPKSFVCRGDHGTTEFKPSKYGVDESMLFDLWDFGPNPPMHCSYSYHVPFGEYRLTAASKPGMAIAADRNPWIDSPFEKAGDFRAFDPNSGPRAIRAGNTFAHDRDGQNVLFLDNHVSFEKRPFCGVNEDNIYTYWNGEDIRRGTPPKLGSKPADKMDSLLVNDPAISR